MRLLLDTRVLLWWLDDDKRLSAEAREAVAVATDVRVRHHDDPFDRMLVAQARLEDLTLVTADRRLPDYGVSVLVAG